MAEDRSFPDISSYERNRPGRAPHLAQSLPVPTRTEGQAKEKPYGNAENSGARHGLYQLSAHQYTFDERLGSMGQGGRLRRWNVAGHLRRDYGAPISR
jgi:hypothetical protein